MSMLGSMLKGPIKEGETELLAIDAEITVAEAKINPIVQKIAPFIPEILSELAAVSPTLAKYITKDELQEVGLALGQLPSLMAKLHVLVGEAEAKLKAL